jgi:hypothetical protein
MGDSLCAAARQQWQARLAGTQWLDAGEVCYPGLSTEVGPAQMSMAPRDSTVIVSLGTNDLVAERIREFRGHVAATLAAAAGRNVIWVMPGVNHTSSRYRLEGSAIEVLRREAARYPNVRLLDWDREYNRYPREQLPDGVHSTERGYGIRVAYIMQALNRTAPTSVP